MTDSAHSDVQRNILVVHGRDFKPPAESLADICFAALRAGIKRDFPGTLSLYDETSRELAYYGDLSNALLHEFKPRYDEQLDIGDRRNALAAMREVPARKRFGIRQYDRLPGKSALREACADVLSPTLGTLGFMMPMVSAVSKDFAAYLKNRGDYASQVRERVRSKLVASMQRGDQLMLLAHGTGSAVVWDVLWQLSHDDEYKQAAKDCKVDLLLTMGSPLGDAHIRRRLAGAREKVVDRFPTNVISWHNVSAEDDYTCHDKTLADDFKRMMSERIVSAVHDYKIYNHAVRYGRSNPHSSVGYLIHPRVSKIVADWLQAGEPVEDPIYTL